MSNKAPFDPVGVRFIANRTLTFGNQFWLNALKEANLPPIKFLYMPHIVYLDEHGPSKMSDIARAIGSTPANLTASGRVLEELGLIARVKGEKDARQVWVTLTDLGRRYAAAAAQAWEVERERRYAGITGTELKRLQPVVEKIARNLGD